MKNILNFRAGALFLGLALAFAGSAFTASEQPRSADGSQQTRWFQTDPEGDLIHPYQMIDPASTCDGDEEFCAKQYYVNSNNQPVSPTGLVAKRTEL